MKRLPRAKAVILACVWLNLLFVGLNTIVGLLDWQAVSFLAAALNIWGAYRCLTNYYALVNLERSIKQ